MKPSNQPVGASQGSAPSSSAAEQHLLDLVDVERLEQRLVEVAVERADADPCAACYLLQRGGLTALGKRLARSREHLLVIAPRVGPAGAA